MKIRTIVYKAVKITGRSLISFVTLWRMESPHIEYPTNIEKVIEMDIIWNMPLVKYDKTINSKRA